MAIWIDVENSAGTKYGGGPITSAEAFRFTRRLDRAGEFSFRMPAADPMANEVQQRRYVSVYEASDSGPLKICRGIIESVTIDARPGEPVMIEVTGPDMAGELNHRLLIDVPCYATTVETPSNVVRVYDSGSSSDVFSNAFDDNTGTTESYTFKGISSGDWLYVHSTKQFNGVVFDLGNVFAKS